jgi:hypothetical protein
MQPAPSGLPEARHTSVWHSSPGAQDSCGCPQLSPSARFCWQTPQSPGKKAEQRPDAHCCGAWHAAPVGSVPGVIGMGSPQAATQPGWDPQPATCATCAAHSSIFAGVSVAPGSDACDTHESV